jgi:hypothetical protein
VTKKDEFARSANDIATRAELYQIRAARRRPRAELHLTPHGWKKVVVHQHTDRTKDTRENSLKGRLDSAKERLEKHRARALLRGKARGDFDRER